MPQRRRRDTLSRRLRRRSTGMFAIRSLFTAPGAQINSTRAANHERDCPQPQSGRSYRPRSRRPLRCCRYRTNGSSAPLAFAVGASIPIWNERRDPLRRPFGGSSTYDRSEMPISTGTRPIRNHSRPPPSRLPIAEKPTLPNHWSVKSAYPPLPRPLLSSRTALGGVKRSAELGTFRTRSRFSMTMDVRRHPGFRRKSGLSNSTTTS